MINGPNQAGQAQQAMPMQGNNGAQPNGAAVANNQQNPRLAWLGSQVVNLAKAVVLKGIVPMVGTPVAHIRSLVSTLPQTNFDDVIGGAHRQGNAAFFAAVDDANTCPVGHEAINIVEQAINNAGQISRRGQPVALNHNEIVNFFVAGGHFVSDGAQMFNDMQQQFGALIANQNPDDNPQIALVDRNNSSSHYSGAQQSNQLGIDVYCTINGQRENIGHILFGTFTDAQGNQKSFVQAESHGPHAGGHFWSFIDHVSMRPDAYVQAGFHNTQGTVFGVNGSEKPTWGHWAWGHWEGGDAVVIG